MTITTSLPSSKEHQHKASIWHLFLFNYLDGLISLVSMHVIKPVWKTFNLICCGGHLPTLGSLAALRKRARAPTLLLVGLFCLCSEQTVVGRPSQVSSPAWRRWDEAELALISGGSPQVPGCLVAVYDQLHSWATHPYSSQEQHRQILQAALIVLYHLLMFTITN